MNTRCRCKHNPALKTTVGNKQKKKTHTHKHIVYHARYEKPPKKNIFHICEQRRRKRMKGGIALNAIVNE